MPVWRNYNFSFWIFVGNLVLLSPPPSSFRFVNVNHVFEADATRDSPFLAFKTWEYIFIFLLPLSLYLYIFSLPKWSSEQASSTQRNYKCARNTFLFLFCLNFLFFLSFYMFCIASFSESSKSELITEPVAKASFEIFSKATIFEFVQKIDFTLLFCSCHLHSFKFRAFGIIHFLFLKKKVFVKIHFRICAFQLGKLLKKHLS